MTLMGLVILICGMLIGGAVTSKFAWKRFIDRTRHHDRINERIVHRMHRDLGLSEEQRRQIQDIIHQHRENLQELHLEVQPRLEEELEQMRQEVENVLTPEQARRWNKRYQRLHKNWLPHLEPPAGRPFKHRGPGKRRRPGKGKRIAPSPEAAPHDSLKTDSMTI
jgi:hypothetical protein